MSLKEGKKPLKTKPTLASLQNAAGFVNTLALGPELKAELEKANLKGRFVDYKKIRDNDGLHTKGWKIYKRPKRDTIAIDQFFTGAEPSGYVRRGSMVLAVKDKKAWRAHRDLLDYRAQSLKANFAKQQAEELRQMAKEGNVPTTIFEGYDD